MLFENNNNQFYLIKYLEWWNPSLKIISPRNNDLKNILIVLKSNGYVRTSYVFWCYKKYNRLTRHIQPDSHFTLIQCFIICISTKSHSCHKCISKVICEVNSTPSISCFYCCYCILWSLIIVLMCRIQYTYVKCETNFVNMENINYATFL